jgi:O-antigen biosynthesis protein WbqL
MEAQLSKLIAASDLADALLAPGCAPAMRLQALWPDAGMERDRPRIEGAVLPPVRVLAIPDVEMRSNFLAYKNGAPVCIIDIYPDYIARYHAAGLVPPARSVDGLRIVEEPAFCVSHFNMTIYGHFLLEVLPKVLLARALQDQGFPARIVFPADAGPITEIVRTLCPEESLLLYESAQERLALRRSLHPGIMFSDQMHPMFVAMVRSLAERFAPGQAASDRIFLSRQKWSGYRTLTNEADVFAAASDFGFRLVHPQEMQWPDQVRMFAGASHVISAFDSALHGTMFSPSGATIIGLSRVNELQDGISASLGHRIGYLAPSAGAVSKYNPMAPEPRQMYQVDPGELARKLAAL